MALKLQKYLLYTVTGLFLCGLLRQFLYVGFRHKIISFQEFYQRDEFQLHESFGNTSKNFFKYIKDCFIMDGK